MYTLRELTGSPGRLCGEFHSDDVSGYTINPNTGALTARSAGSPFPAGGEPQSVAVDPSGTFAYVANFRSDNVSGYRISLITGKLTAIPDPPPALR